MYSSVIITLMLGIYLVGGTEHSISEIEAQKQRASHHGVEENSKPAHTTPKYVKRKKALAWSMWSEWSTCSSSIMTGFRVRNRVCPEEATCFGDDVQLIRCNEHAERFVKDEDEVSEKYIKKCKKLGERMGLSCKLYLENPDLAYDIFRKNSCFFTVDPEDDDFSLNNQTVAIPPITDNDEENSTSRENADGVFSVSSNRDGSFRSENFSRPTAETRRANNDESLEISEYNFRLIHALIRERKCKNQCQNTIYHASRLWALTTGFSQSAKNTINILNRNKKLSNGVGNMFFEYNSCIKKCNSVARTHTALSRRRSESGYGNRPNEVQQSQPITRAGEAESLCGDKLRGCPPVTKNYARRRKRQASTIEYESPCFSSENQVPVRKIERKVQAELFFYESNVQRFTCRKCRGTRKVDNAELFLPKEQVRQQNGRPAYCKQGFLKRYALFIVENAEGRYNLGNGQRFNIESRTFDVESHCEIVISK